jgi:hypothetical protein
MHAIGASLLALGGSVDPLGMSRPLRHTLDTLRALALHPLRALAFAGSKALLALHALRPLNIERLPRRLAALGGLRALGALWRRPLAFNLVGIAVITTRASRGRRGNGQRRNAGSEE